MKAITNIPVETPVSVRVASTTQLFRRSLKVHPSAYYGKTSHFRVDVNTVESVMMSFYKWASEGDSNALMSDLGALKQNLCITNPSDKFRV